VPSPYKGGQTKSFVMIIAEITTITKSRLIAII